MTTQRFDELVSRACERAGLNDFGDDSWQEGLRLLINSCESAPGVNPGGREFVYSQFVDALWNRARVIDYFRQHPEIADEKVERRWWCWASPAPAPRWRVTCWIRTRAAGRY